MHVFLSSIYIYTYIFSIFIYVFDVYIYIFSILVGQKYLSGLALSTLKSIHCSFSSDSEYDCTRFVMRNARCMLTSSRTDFSIDRVDF